VIDQDVASLLRKRERVCVFVDNSDLFDALHGRKIDYIKLKEILAAGRSVNRANFYYSEPPPAKFYFSEPPYNKETKEEGEEALIAAKKRQGFYYVLQRAGYTVVCLPQRERHENGDYYFEDALQLEIVYDMCELSSGKFDTFILVAGDEAYVRTVSRVRQDTGINVEIAFFDSSCSGKLKEVGNKFVDLDQEHLVRELFRSEARDAAVREE